MTRQTPVRNTSQTHLVAAVVVPLVASTLVIAFSEYVRTIHSSVPLFIGVPLGLFFAYKAVGRRAPWLAVLYVPVMSLVVLAYLAFLAIILNRYEL